MGYRNITARNADAKEAILKCAMYSYCGRIIYDKWVEKERRFVRRTHVVVPIDAKVITRKDGVERKVLYTVDVEEHNQTKMFIVDQIRNFECYYEKRKVGWDIKLDNIRNVFGIHKSKLPSEETEMAAGAKVVRSLVAKELSKIAQEIYEFSGCEGHLYSDRKKRNPNSYEPVTAMESRIAGRIVADLSESQKKMTEHFTSQRGDLAFGDYFQWNAQGRCYKPLQQSSTVQDLSKIDDDNAREIFQILKQQGYVCPDYAAGYCYKESDKEYATKNAPKVLTILKKALRNDKETFARLSKSFNERESGALKHRGEINLMMCITHNPEDVAGMSTDRNWLSCMRLPVPVEEVSEKELRNIAGDEQHERWFIDFYGLFGRRKKPLHEIAKESGMEDNESKIKHVISLIKDKLDEGGAYYSTALKQVKSGGIVAYLIREDDKDIKNPLARVAVKRLSNQDGGFKFVAENRIYGEEHVANSCNFMGVLKEELAKSNKTTEKGDSIYRRGDSGWTDAHIYNDYGEISVGKLCKFDWEQVYDALNDNAVHLSEDDVEQILKSHGNQRPSKGVVGLLEKSCGGFSEEFVKRHSDVVDVDKFNYYDGIPLESSSAYEGDDAPRNEEQMLKFVRKAMATSQPLEGNGEISDDNDCATFENSLNPVDIVHRTDLPDDVLNYAVNTVSEGLKNYYDARVYDDGDFRSRFPNFALFEEAFNDGTGMDDDLYDEIYDSLYDSVAYGGEVLYEASVHVKDVSDGYKDHNSVYVMDGTIIYTLPRTFGEDKHVVAYENVFVINTEDGGWKKKLSECLKDLFDQCPTNSYW